MIKLEQIRPNFTKVFVNGHNLWFSYETLIAYQFQNGQFVCSENQWSVTTSKHLNELEPNKSKRMKAESFNALIKGLEIR